MRTVGELLEFAASNDRVCPKENQWKALWELLHAVSRAKSGPRIEKPLVGDAWRSTSSLMKRQRLRIHLEQARQLELFEAVCAMIVGFSESEWAHELELASEPPAKLASIGPPRTDQFKLTVAIPVQLINGGLVEFGKETLPALGDCVGDLIVPAFAVTSETDRLRLTQEKVSEILAAGTVLRCRLSGYHVPSQLLPKCEFYKLPRSPLHSAFVELVVHEPLRLRRRGSKRSKLENAHCSVPALEDASFASLNEAYRSISQRFEPTRRSFGGNVFQNVYYFSEDRGTWGPLEELRA